MTDHTEGRTPLTDDELERIRDLADDDIATVRDMRLVLAELERLNSWHGLMSVLDEKYPEDIFPTREDDDARDPGPRIVSLVRWVDRLRAENKSMRENVAHAAAIVAGESNYEEIEAVRTERDRLRTRLAEADRVALHNTETFVRKLNEANAENAALAAKLDRAMKLASEMCDCDDPDSPATDPDTGLPLKHHCECPALYMETALDPALGHQHEPCLSQTAAALGGDQDGGDRG